MTALLRKSLLASLRKVESKRNELPQDRPEPGEETPSITPLAVVAKEGATPAGDAAAPSADVALESEAETGAEAVEVVASPEDEPPAEVSQDKSTESSPEKRWNAYRSRVESLFSTVPGRPQATRLLERELAAIGVEDGGYLAATQF